MIGKWKPALLAALFAALAGGAANGQGYADQDYPYASSEEAPIQQTVARLSYISGDVSFARGDDPDDWQPADPNVPMTLGDRVWTADGRLELQIHGGTVVRMAKRTDLAALNLTDDTKQFSISAGVASFRVRRLYEDEVFEVDTPNAAITFESPGDYRIDVRPDGDTRLQVRSGRAVVAAGGGQIPIDGGEAMMIDGDQPPRYDFIPMGYPDGWDGWVSDREGRYRNVRSYQYVSHSIAGVEDLDTYGSWQRIPSYGWCWTPASVTVGWAPYRAGRWLWQDPWGWTWVSTEPWGWAPYHYGRWVTYSSRWFWVPVAPAVAVVAYRPALVAFVGGGPGFGVSVGFSTDYVGWFPLAPREPFIPWWGTPAVNVNVTNVTYINRTYVTVVNQQTFVQSQAVTTNYVRDASVIQRIERAPVVRGAIPIVPTQASIRVSTRTAASVPHPPQQVAQRAVVTRMAPPPAPPRFDEKVQVIRQQRGAPVNAAQAQKLAVERGQSKAQVPVRPAAEAGRVQLAPRGDTARGKQPEPVAAPRGRELATAERPVAPQAPVPAEARGRQKTPPREVPEPQAPVRQAQPQREAPPAREVQREAPPQRTAPPAREVQREREAPPPEARSQRNPAQEREAPPPRATRPPREAAPDREASPDARSRDQRQSYATPEHGRRPTPRANSDQPPTPRERQVAPPPSEKSQPRNETETRSQENRGHEKAEAKPTQKPNHDRSKPRPTPEPD
jgi:Family of unknown function (DUF6600)/FecR protein